jgi:DNA-binding CsgD family transcriptional regulator
MTYLSAAAVRQIQNLSWQLSACRTVPQLETEAVQWLFDNLPCMYAAFTDHPALATSTRIRIVPTDVDKDAIESRVREHFAAHQVTDHPLIAHYFYQWQPVTPLRMSDLLSDRQLRRTRAYNEVLQPLGITHQIALISRRVSPTINAGYTVMRHNRDFSDAELDLTIMLQPMLLALHQAVSVQPQPAPPEVAARLHLTATELEILNLLATGMTAVSIGHARRISPRTVRKHLERIYTKLGMHDRLQAVTYARCIGLVPPCPKVRDAVDDP